MAREMKVVLTDDLDGSEAAETIRFMIDRATYEIELSSDNAEKFRAVLAPYVAKARRVSASGSTSARRSSGSSKSNSDSAKIRAWAKEQGKDVSDRGRIPAELADEYYAAVGR